MSFFNRILDRVTNLQRLSVDPALSNLCQSCQRVFSGRRPDSELGGPHLHSLGQTLQQSQASVNMCRLCRIRLAQISTADLRDLSPNENITYGYWESRVGNGIAFQYMYADAARPPLQISIAMVETQDFNAAIALQQARVSAAASTTVVDQSIALSSTLDQSTMNVLLYWMRKCNQDHQLCKGDGRVYYQLPSRLIDLGSAEQIEPVLCLGIDLPSDTTYATLSHCWGGRGESYLRLLQSNVNTMKISVPVAELSKTFWEAMMVCRRLSIRYIWIDSLCIIQDSKDDWATEAALMGSVYRNAAFNIAATASSNGSEGLFRGRMPLDVEPCRIEVSWPNSRGRQYFCYGIGEWEREVEQQPLSSRAWVTQEIILAPRVIHFSRNQVFWECRQLRASESFPDGMPNFKIQKPSLQKAVIDPALAWLSTADGNYPLHEIWEDVIKLYTKCNLTFPTKDKLVAASGMAKTLGIPADEYLAGLWRSGLADQLLWSVKRPEADEIHPRHSTDYRAPSWSWASVDGPVFLRVPTRNSLQNSTIHVLEAHTTSVNRHDPFGQVSAGHIRLKGLLAFCKITEQVIIPNTTPQFRNGKLVDVPLRAGAPRQPIKHLYLGKAHANIGLDDSDCKNGDHYYCLLANVQFGGCGLVIKPTERRRGEYIRCGYFAILTGKDPNSPAKFLDECRNFSAATGGEETLFEDRAEIDQNGIQHYVITIV